MAEDHQPDRPTTLEDAVATAHDILDQLRARWKEGGMLVEVLAHAMIGSGMAAADLEGAANA